MKAIDYVIVTLILGLSLAFALTQTEHTGLNPAADVIGSDGYPRILTVLAIICCAWMVGFSSYQKWKRPDLKEKRVVYTRGMLIKLAVFCVAIVLYIIGFLKIGFCVSTIAFITLLTMYLESFARKSIPYAVTYGLTVTAVCHYTFEFFNILVPDTILL